MPRIPRIPAPIIDQLPSPRDTTLVAPPIVEGLQQPVVDIPSYEPPDWRPPIQQAPIPESPPDPEPSGPPVAPGVPMDQVRELTEDEGMEERESSPPEPLSPTLPPLPQIPQTPRIPAARPEIDVPVLGVVPLPYPREVTLAGTTAVAATTAALVGKSMVEQLLKIFKPIAKKVLLKLKERMGTQFTDYEIQQFFEFEGRTPDQKKLLKRLAKEQAAEKAAQFESAQRPRRRKPKRKAKKGGSVLPIVVPLHISEDEPIQSPDEL